MMDDKMFKYYEKGEEAIRLSGGTSRVEFERTKEVPGYFTTAYFHRPEELAEEIKEAGFSHLRTIGLQGPSWLLGDFDEQWEDLERKKIILEVLRLIEDEATLLGISAHLLALAKKE